MLENNKKDFYYYLQKFYRKIKSNINTENYNCFIDSPDFSDFINHCFINIYHKQYKDEPAFIIGIKKTKKSFKTMNIILDNDLSTEDLIEININNDLRTFNSQELENYIDYLNVKLKIYHKYYFC